MDYREAVSIVTRNQNLIGQSFNGGTIDELIIRPVNITYDAEFTSLYLSSLNANDSLSKFRSCDLYIDVVIDKYRIHSESVFLRASIDAVINQLKTANNVYKK